MTSKATDFGLARLLFKTRLFSGVLFQQKDNKRIFNCFETFYQNGLLMKSNKRDFFSLGLEARHENPLNRLDLFSLWVLTDIPPMNSDYSVLAKIRESYFCKQSVSIHYRYFEPINQ